MKYFAILSMVTLLGISALFGAGRWDAGHGWNQIGSRPVAAWYR